MKRGILRPARVLAAAIVLAAGTWCASAGPEPPDRDREHRDRHEHDATVRHGFGDVERWVERFDDPARDDWQKPEEVLRFLGVGPDSRVADLGAGTGYFTVRIARAVGSGGVVWAVDVEPGLVEHVASRAESEGLPWIRPVLAAADDPALPEGEVDLVLVVNTWHHIDDRLDYLGRLARALAPGGRVAVVDYRAGDLPVGPRAGHKISRHHVLGEFTEAGWLPVGELETLPYQYVLVFEPPAVAAASP